MKNISIIGSTGSVGTQSVAVAQRRGYKVEALTAGYNVELIAQQARALLPKIVAVKQQQDAKKLKEMLSDMQIKVLYGKEGLTAAASHSVDLVINATVGIAGLAPTLAAIDAGNTLALANKESLVCAGDIVMPLAKAKNVQIIPVDSEHSAIFQCLTAGRAEDVRKIILTASGGPFFGMSIEEMHSKTPEQTLKHPNWDMGNKITVDSATMFNKGFEMIEAMHLFGTKPENIEIVVHRQSTIHSMVEFADGAVIAQLSTPDMALPIQLAVDWPRRVEQACNPIDFSKLSTLTFAPADEISFPSISLCRRVMQVGGTLGAAVNGANEAAVEAFLQNRIPFGEIYRLVNQAAQQVPFVQNPSIEDIYNIDKAARAAVEKALL